MILNFKRIIRYGILALWRNGWLTLSAVVVMTVTLIALSSLIVVNQLAELSADNLQNRVSISVYLQEGTTDEKLDEVKEGIESFEEIRSVNTITSAQALEDFRKKHQDDDLIQASLDEFGEDNPLLPSLVIVAHELDFYPIISQKLNRSRFYQIFHHINYEDNRELIERLDGVTAGIKAFGIAITAIFGFIAIAVMFNTQRLTIFSRKEEIEIMRLVGASNSYIRGPFLVEGIVYGLIATLVSSGILYPVMRAVEPKINLFFELDLSAGTFLSEFWLLVLIQLAVGVALGVISSVIATKKYLKV